MLSTVASLGIAVPAIAQETAEEVVVTGSRIKAANLEATSPVTQVTAEDVISTGITRVEDLVNQLPQAFAAQNATVANGSTGTATIDLRGLGSARTLVLVDGRRMPYGGVTNSAADVNQVPAQMIERVEVLTGGASAVYGSDAVAGVVNFILKKDFEGVEVTGQYNFYQHNNSYGGPGDVKLRERLAARIATNPAQYAFPDDNVTDGFGREAAVMMGVNSGDGKGNITLYATVFDGDEILQADRDFSACSLGNTAANLALLSPNPAGTKFSCGGSGTAAGGQFTDFATYAFTTAAGGGWRNYNGNLDAYNFGPLNHFLRPEKRYTLGANGHYELSEKADVYAQVMYTDYQSVAQIAPSGNFFETSTINCDNPLLPAANLADIGCDGETDRVTMYIGRRNVEGGGRQQAFNNASFRTVVGVRGAINEAWNYDVSAQFANTKATQRTLNYLVIEREKRALDVISVDGVPTCRSVVDGTDPNCVPWNIFTAGGVTREALNYLQAAGLQIGSIDQEVYMATVAGDLGVYGWKTPWAQDGAQVVFGAEYRRDSLNNQVDALQEAGQLGGSGGATLSLRGSSRVNDYFVEAKLPIAQGAAFAESLSLDAAYRKSEYDNGINTDTYKIGAEWAPISDVRFRGSYSRAVRAANIVELFASQTFNLFDMDADGDPCGPAILEEGAIATVAECVANGVPLAQVGSESLVSPAGQYQNRVGGNPDLVPEEADTVSFGVVFTPTFVENLSITLDWFNIKIDKTISTVGSQITLIGCFENNDQAACDRINRSPGGSLWVGGGYVEDLNINIGSLETTGIDLNASYGFKVGDWGALSFNLTGTYLDKLTTDPGGGFPTYDCVGLFAGNCGTPKPDWRHKFRLGWQTPWNVDLSLAWRHFGAVKGDGQAATRIDYKLGAQNYVDLAANWAVTEKASINVGINNVFDRDPPLSASVGTTGNGNTFPQTYDALGRFIFARATVKF